MKHGAITFAFLLAAGAAGSVLFTGCSDDEPQTNQPAADSGVDSSPVPDTGRPDSTPADTGPKTCAAPLDGFACEPAADRTGKTVCTDEMITEFMNCFGMGDTAKCNAARMKYPACNTCVLSDWLKINEATGSGGLDIGACIKKIDPASNCSEKVNCASDCTDHVCVDCDDTPGSGSTGSMSSNALRECRRDVAAAGSASKPKGACYDLAFKDYTACANDMKFQYCFVNTVADLEYFLRGACRDGGNWSNVTTDKPTTGDAGTDSGSDSGSDTGTSSTDSGSDTATATDAADAD